MRLNFQEWGTGFPLIILHGLFGSLDNWSTIGRRLSEHCRVFAVDLRNHGRSPHSNEINYEVIAGDLVEFMETHSLSRAHVLGHSLGGKVAMVLALLHPELVARLIVVDMAPRAYPPHHLSIIAALRSPKLESFTNRSEIDVALAASIPEPPVRQFLLKSVFRDERGAFVWKLNLPAIDENYGKLIRGIDSSSRFEGPVLFIKGERSDYIQNADQVMIKRLFPLAEFKTIDGAGHWVHVDAPEAFAVAISGFIQSNNDSDIASVAGAHEAQIKTGHAAT